jgi:hypothetical protein
MRHCGDLIGTPGNARVPDSYDDPRQLTPQALLQSDNAIMTLVGPCRSWGQTLRV